jgi:3'-phosphoadenosine 5'-phosphosulfate sulfotransferase (PAPS reductase)/FAD synthetase
MSGLAIVSISGGKDSTVTALVAIDRCGADNVRLVFADTGHEHPATVEYVRDYLPARLGLPVETVKADFRRQMAGKRAWIQKHWAAAGVPDHRIARALELLHPTGNPYLDMCLWKGRFPSRKAQFCTELLKSIPLNAYMSAAPYFYDDEGREIPNESWRGVRRDESEARKGALEDDLDATQTGRIFRIIQPIVTWTALEVFAFAASRGVEMNPLYRKGMKRVGCMPCINCTKDELLAIALQWPEEVERVAEWEGLVSEASKRGATTFFHGNIDIADATPEQIYAAVNIGQMIGWAKTSRGGKQYDMLRGLPQDGCSSQYGLCE